MLSKSNKTLANESIQTVLKNYAFLFSPFSSLLNFLIKKLNQQNVESNTGIKIEEVWIVRRRNQRRQILHDLSMQGKR
jgi:hypothetical protein